MAPNVRQNFLHLQYISIAITVVVISSCGILKPNPVARVSGKGGDAATAPVCKPTDLEDSFKTTLWPKVFQACASCHVKGGMYSATNPSGPFQFLDSSASSANFNVVNQMASKLNDSGQSLLVSKASGGDRHGGRMIYSNDSVELGLLKTFVQNLSSSGNCPKTTAPVSSQVAAVASIIPPSNSACSDKVQQEFFTTTWSSVFSTCSGCHGPNGSYVLSGGVNKYILNDPTATMANYNVVFRMAQIDAEGSPILIEKASGLLAHGGGEVFTAGSKGLSDLTTFVNDVRTATQCQVTSSAAVPMSAAIVDFTSGLNLLSPADTLTKASQLLIGRLPTQVELSQVSSSDINSIDNVLLPMMNEPGFANHFMDMMNDMLLTDWGRYTISYGSVVKLATGQYVPLPLTDPATGTFGTTYYPNNAYGGFSAAVIDSVAREPLALAAYVVRNDRPFTEILTANYRVVNRLSAQLYKLNVASLPFKGSAYDFSEYVEAQTPWINQGEYSGILTSTAFLARYPASASNRGRKRAYHTIKYFLGLDILKNAPRLDLSNVKFSENPWRNSPQCTGCHSIMDPVAGTFQNWTNCYDSSGAWYIQPQDRYCGSGGGWYSSTAMFSPGTGPAGSSNANVLTPQQLVTGTKSLASYIVNQPGFAQSMTEHFFKELTRVQDLSTPPAQAVLADLVQGFTSGFSGNSNLDSKKLFNMKYLLLQIVKSPYFRAASATVSSPNYSDLGGVLLTPEQVHDKIISVFGVPWGSQNSVPNTASFTSSDSNFYLLAFNGFRLFAGGIDSITAVDRQRTPGSLTSAVYSRMAHSMSCSRVPIDFSNTNKATRKLFPYVDATTLITTGNQAAILQNIQYLHKLIVGETLATSDPEIQATYNLLTSVNQTGSAAITAGSLSTSLSGACRVGASDPVTGVAISGGLTTDPKYVIRSWQAVVDYLMSDYKFLFN